jgi:hypothetical protein
MIRTALSRAQPSNSIVFSVAQIPSGSSGSSKLHMSRNALEPLPPPKLTITRGDSSASSAFLSFLATACFKLLRNFAKLGSPLH